MRQVTGHLDLRDRSQQGDPGVLQLIADDILHDLSHLIADYLGAVPTHLCLPLGL